VTVDEFEPNRAECLDETTTTNDYGAVDPGTCVEHRGAGPAIQIIVHVMRRGMAWREGGEGGLQGRRLRVRWAEEGECVRVCVCVCVAF
jgi:hypothetical protein